MDKSLNKYMLTGNECWLTALLCLFFTVPCFYRVFLNGSDSVWYLMAAIVASLPLAFILQSIRRLWVFVLVLTFILLSPFVESFLIVVYHDFIRTGNLLSVATTTKRESGNFFANNFKILVYEIPVVLLYIASIIQKKRTETRARVYIYYVLITPLFTFLVSLCGYRVFSNPPYNIYVEESNAMLQQLSRRLYIGEGDKMTFGAERDTVSEREIYVFGVGESLRYDHTTLGGYERNTTPLLAQNPNLISFSDYCSTATLTFYSVPMMLSRATSKNFNLHYRQRGVAEVYKECGFKVYVISCKKLLANQPYLTRGADSIFAVSNDIEAPRLIDSLSTIYPKTFFIVQLLQCHSYYNNFTPEFDKYHPNLVSDEGVKSDSLYLNAYDNCVLYTDHVISAVLDTINKPGVRSALLFASDHGEILTMHGSRRGNSLTPTPDEYHVPFIFWYSDAWKASHASALTQAMKHKDEPLNADVMFYSACDMADITLPERYAKPEKSIFSENFTRYKRLMILPDGRSLKNQDKHKK